MPPATLNSALLFPPADRVAAVTRDQSRTPPLEPQPRGCRGGRHRPQHPLRKKKEVRNPGNKRKHKHSRRGRNWKCYQVCGHGNISVSPAPSRFLGLQTFRRTGTAARRAARGFCSVTRNTVPLAVHDLCFYLRDQKHILNSIHQHRVVCRFL